MVLCVLNPLDFFFYVSLFDYSFTEEVCLQLTSDWIGDTLKCSHSFRCIFQLVSLEHASYCIKFKENYLI